MQGLTPLSEWVIEASYREKDPLIAVLERCIICLQRGEAAMASSCWNAYMAHKQRTTNQYVEPICYLMQKGDYQRAADSIAYGLIPFLCKKR